MKMLYNFYNGRRGLSIEIIHSEKQNKITGVIPVIARFTPESKMKNKTFTIFL